MCVCECVCVNVSVCTSVCACVCVHTWASAYTSVCRCVRTHACPCMSACTCNSPVISPNILLDQPESSYQLKSTIVFNITAPPKKCTLQNDLIAKILGRKTRHYYVEEHLFSFALQSNLAVSTAVPHMILICNWLLILPQCLLQI